MMPKCFKCGKDTMDGKYHQAEYNLPQYFICVRCFEYMIKIKEDKK